jgi:maltose O-acetyltransferase
MADIGAECVIGAGSVVVKPVPAQSVAVGNPSTVIRSRAA